MAAFGWKFEREHFNEVFGYQPEGVVKEAQMPGYFFSILFGNVLGDLEIKIPIESLVRILAHVVGHHECIQML